MKKSVESWVTQISTLNAHLSILADSNRERWQPFLIFYIFHNQSTSFTGKVVMKVRGNCSKMLSKKPRRPERAGSYEV